MNTAPPLLRYFSDEHWEILLAFANPYFFLLEGNRENQRMVEELEAREVVRDDAGMLERSGFEAVIDKTGKLAIRPRDNAAI